MLAVPSLNPNRFRGVACVVEVEDVRPNPSCDHLTDGGPERDSREVADRMDGNLGIVGARLDGDVAPAPIRVEVVRTEVGEIEQGSRFLVCEPETVVEK